MLKKNMSILIKFRIEIYYNLVILVVSFITINISILKNIDSVLNFFEKKKIIK